MNSTVTINTGPDSPRELVPDTPLADAHRRDGAVEGWLGRHLDAVALTVIAAGFVLRIVVASRSYLNPDELLHYLIIHQPSLFLAYKASLSNAHPPLIYILVYFVHLFSNSELALRLPSVFAGTALCWVLYKWIGTILGKAAGLIGLVIVTFCPALIVLSAEIREYALLLFCMGTALYFLERAFQEKSVPKMWVFSIFLYLAILSHYSAVFFALAVGVYALTRFADSQFPRRFLVAWAGGQVAALAIYAFLYVTQISQLRNAIPIWGLGYDDSYFRPDRVSIFTFTKIHTSNIFLFLFAQQHISQAMFVFFVVGIAFLFFRDMVSRSADVGTRHLGILLLMPFLAVWGASVARIYPYVGSRHTVFLAPFAIAAASFFLARISGQNLWAGFAIASLLMGVSNVYGNSPELGIATQDQSRSLMTSAMSYIQQSVPQGDVILADYESSVTLAYYLCGTTGQIPQDAYSGGIGQYSCAGHPIVATSAWKLIAENLPSQFEKMTHSYGLKPGDRAWVFQAGWGETFGRTLPGSSAAFRCAVPKSFGANLAIVPFIVGPDYLPVALTPTC